MNIFLGVLLLFFCSPTALLKAMYTHVIHTPTAVYHCNYGNSCSKYFFAEHTYIKHGLEHHNYCAKCNLILEDEDLAKTHFQQEHLVTKKSARVTKNINLRMAQPPQEKQAGAEFPLNIEVTSINWQIILNQGQPVLQRANMIEAAQKVLEGLCYTCGEKFSSSEKKQLHELVIHKNCKRCNFIFPSSEEGLMHGKTYHPELCKVVSGACVFCTNFKRDFQLYKTPKHLFFHTLREHGFCIACLQKLTPGYDSMMHLQVHINQFS